MAYCVGMSGATKAGIAVILSVVAIATVCVYWTRTPQYALLHVLRSEGGHGLEQGASPVNREGGGKKARRLPQRTEKLMDYLVRLQNETLEQTYGVRVETISIEQRRAVLIVKLNETIYSIPFYEQPDGCWRLAAFEKRERFLREASEQKKDNRVSIIARL